MLVTICNYDRYQDKQNYEGHNEGHTDGTDIKKKGISNKGKKEKTKDFSSDSIEIGLSNLLFNLLHDRDPEEKQPDMQDWARHIDQLIRKKNRSPEKIKAVIEWCQAHNFWQNVIVDTSKLSKNFKQLFLQMGGSNGRGDANRTGKTRSYTSPNAHLGDGAPNRVDHTFDSLDD
jgi:hypothetical protein